MPNILADLNPDQQQAVTYLGTPLLILAGAGSGKTRALTYRAAYLMLEHHIPPDQILLTTFTNKAANEMQVRLERLTGHKLPYAGTFHSLCARFLRKHGSKLGIGHDFVIYDPNDQIDLIKQIFHELDLDPQLIKPRGILAAIESAKNDLVTPSEYHSFARGPFQQAVANIFPRYQQKLRDYHALDFTDLLIEGVRLFKEFPEVRQFYREQFQHILIDEYQDTNKAQYALTKLWLGEHQNLCVVGDASQAIYSWRGADYKNLLLLKVDFPSLKTIKLEQNYRSTQNILDAAYGIIRQNEMHPILELWTDSNYGESIHLYEAKDEYDEAKYCVRQIQTYQNEGHNLNDSAVLFRTNAQSRVFEEVFLEKGIPYILVGGVKFYERKEIKDVLAYLRYAYNREDLISRDRLAKISKRKLALFQSWLETADLSKPALILLEEILAVTSYLSKYDPHDPEDQSRIENVQELKSVAQSFSDIGSFLENMSLAEQDSRSDKNAADAVTLMTLHASKGLEFDQVLMVGMEEGIFPHSRSVNSRPDLEEERRLCYVGITRARKKLHLTYTRSRLYFGIRSQNMTSRFIDELPSHVLEKNNPPDRYDHAPGTVDSELLNDFLSGKVSIDDFLDS